MAVRVLHVGGHQGLTKSLFSPWPQIADGDRKGVVPLWTKSIEKLCNAKKTFDENDKKSMGAKDSESVEIEVVERMESWLC